MEYLLQSARSIDRQMKNEVRAGETVVDSFEIKSENDFASNTNSRRLVTKTNLPPETSKKEEERKDQVVTEEDIKLKFGY